MFKYGSIRNFIVKFLVGIVLFGFGLIYFTSLYSYSENDPGFNQLSYDINDSNIESTPRLKKNTTKKVITEWRTSSATGRPSYFKTTTLCG